MVAASSVARKVTLPGTMSAKGRLRMVRKRQRKELIVEKIMAVVAISVEKMDILLGTTNVK